MNLSPDTLQEESDWERIERQRRTGVMGVGFTVSCTPFPIEPNIVQMQHRSVCMTRPYPGCIECPHRSFTLIIRAQPPDPYELIACPRWKDYRDRATGFAPDTYVAVERKRCSEQPFEFCTRCPSEQALVDVGASKVRAGWYGRWQRITKDEDEDG